MRLNNLIELKPGINEYSRKADGDKTITLGGKPTNFRLSEFACHDGSDTILLDRELVDRLQRIREKFGAVRINSGYRTPTHNAKVGGVRNSQHVQGRAADINPYQVRVLMPLTVAMYAETIGCGGVFSYADFVHVDTRETITRGDYSRRGYANGGTFIRTIRQGHSGDHVKVLQALLALRVDGIFGRETSQAVLRFQTASKLKPDAIVGRKTWTALLS